MKVNLDVIKSLLLDVPVGIGLLAGLLSAIGLGSAQVGYVTGIVVAAAALGVFVIGAIKRTSDQTDTGKAASFDKLDDAGQQAVLDRVSNDTLNRLADRLPEEIKVNAVQQLPDVKQVVISDTPSNGLKTLADDPTVTKVVTESQAKVA